MIATSSQRKVLEATEALENIVKKRDPALPLEAHTLKVAKASEKLKRNLDKQAQALEDFRNSNTIIPKSFPVRNSILEL